MVLDTITKIWNNLIPRLSTNIAIFFIALFLGYNLLLLPLYPIPGTGDFVAGGIYVAFPVALLLIPTYIILFILEQINLIKFRFKNKFITQSKFYRIFAQINFVCFLLCVLGIGLLALGGYI